MQKPLIFFEHKGGKPGFDLNEPENQYVDKSILFKKNEENPCIKVTKKENNVINIKLSYYIGYHWLKVKERWVGITPKLDDEKVKINYLKMLMEAFSHAANSNHLEDLYEIKLDEEFINIDNHNDLITPLLVLHYLQLLKSIVKKGLKKGYYPVEKEMNARVKGKVLVGQTIKNGVFKGRTLMTSCRYDEFGLNCTENRILKKALRFGVRYLAPILKQTKGEGFQRDISYINSSFEFVDDEIETRTIQNFKKNVFYKEYEPALKVAQHILRRFGYNYNATANLTTSIPPFWIDMSKLFELYVWGKLKEKLGSGVIFQYNANYGQPDFLLAFEKIIADAKYKTYYNERFTDQAKWKRDYIAGDIRQLSGYARDRKIIKEFGIEPPNIIPCLIIYPDQIEGNLDFKEIDSFIAKATEIPEMEKFYKIGIKLP